MKNLGAVFYLVLGILTLSIFVLLGVWARTHDVLYLYLLLAVFFVYVIFLISSLVRKGRAFKKDEKLRSELLVFARNGDLPIVHMTYLGGKRNLARPSKRKKDYLVQFYDGGADRGALGRHLWFDLPEEEENALRRHMHGEMNIPYALLADIRGKYVFAQAAFCAEAERSPRFEEFFRENTVTPYGE